MVSVTKMFLFIDLKRLVSPDAGRFFVIASICLVVTYVSGTVMYTFKVKRKADHVSRISGSKQLKRIEMDRNVRKTAYFPDQTPIFAANHSTFMRSFLIIILCFAAICSAVTSAAAGGIRGRISTSKGEPLPYAGISVKGTSVGTIANEDGLYELSLAPGNHEIVFQYLGFKTATHTVTITAVFQELNVTLEDQALNLREATVGTGKEDPAYTIMRKAIAKARFHQLQVRSYTARVYARSTALPTKIPYLVEKRLKKEGVQEGKAILNESVSEIKYRRPNTFNQHIISTRNSLDNSIPSPNEYILASFYSPEVAGTVSPLSPKAFGFYRFEYQGFFEDRGQIVNKIKVIPRAYGEGVFRGSLYILEDRWAIHSFDLETTARGLDIEVKQLFSPLQNVWLPVNQHFRIKGGYLGFAGEFKYLVSVNYHKMDVDPNLKEEIVIRDEKLDKSPAGKIRKQSLDKLIAEQKEFSTKNFRKLTRAYEKEQKKERKAEIEGNRMVRQDSITVDTLANKRDSTYWNTLRPIPLTNSEVAGYVLQDSLIVAKEAEGIKKRPDSTNVKLKHFLLGNTYYLGKSNYLTFESPILALGFNTVEGYAVNVVLEYEKKWGSSYHFSVRPLARYSFGRQKLYGTIETNIGNRNWNLNITGGEMASQINQNKPILPFINSLATRFFERNLMKLYQKQFIRAEYSRPYILDIFSVRTSLEYENRKELFNMENLKPLLFWDRFAYTPNRPPNLETANTGFPNNNALLFEFNLDIRPWQRYIVRNGQKRYTRNRQPIFGFQYKAAIPSLGTDANYDYLQGSIRQAMDLGPRIDLDYVVSAGKFIGKRTLYFTDFRHFMGGEFFLLTGSPLSDFRMLPYYLHSTSDYFVQGHAMLSLKNLAVTRIPALRLTGIKETLQVHYLRVPTVHNYTELVYGIDNILRVIRLELVGQFHGLEFQKLGYRVGTSFRIGNTRR